MLTADAAALCAAVDAGDDSALPALADALEEAQDQRAAGLRHACLREGYDPHAPFRDDRGLWAWYGGRGSGGLGPSRLCDDWFYRLPGASPPGATASYWTSRSLAFLALAQALTDVEQALRVGGDGAPA